MKRICLFLIILLVTTMCSVVLYAQPQERIVRMIVSPDNNSWNYKTGQNVTFTISAYRCGIPVDGVEMRYELAEDMMPTRNTGSVMMHKGKATIFGGTMRKPGFLRLRVFCEIDGNKYEEKGTVGFDVDKINATVRNPSDFQDFWKQAVNKARKVPLNPRKILMPELCTDKVDVYQVSFANASEEARMYGILCVPKAAGPHPAVLKLPGHGVRGYKGDAGQAAKGCIVLEMGIHGIPVDMQPEVYLNLRHGALDGYHSMNMNDRDKFYYKRVITGLVRAIDFLETLPEYNGRLGTFGGSQGGGLSIIMAGLDPRVNGLVAWYPAMCDMEGYAHGRAGGWPHTLKNKTFQTDDILNTVCYFDAVNFARRIKVPGFYTMGYNDMVCPPTSTFSAVNAINAPKQIVIAETTEHYAYQEQRDAAWKWIIDFLHQGE